MLLAIDIGNTNTVVGVFDSGTLVHYFRLASNRSLTVDEAGFLCEGLLGRLTIGSSQITGVAICSVVPVLTSVFEGAAETFFGRKPLIVSNLVDLPIKLDVDHPEQVGADRIANGVAGFALAQGAVIVVDFGTATTFDVVTPDRRYIGGVILPGPETAFGELARKAARLFEVRFAKPSSVIGRTTTGALQSGMFYGTVAQVDYLVAHISSEAGFNSPMVIATGGLSAGIDAASKTITRVEPTLTLDGIFQIFKRLN